MKKQMPSKTLPKPKRKQKLTLVQFDLSMHERDPVQRNVLVLRSDRVKWKRGQFIRFLCHDEEFMIKRVKKVVSVNKVPPKWIAHFQLTLNDLVDTLTLLAMPTPEEMKKLELMLSVCRTTFQPTVET